MTPKTSAHPSGERLNDYLDGLLAPADSDSIARHVDGCPTCRSEVRFHAELLDAAAGLPEGVAPSRDLWPGIAARLKKRGTGRVRFRIVPGGFRFPVPLAAAAGVAVLVVATSLVTAHLVARDDARTIARHAGLYEGRVALAAFESAEDDYAEATRQLLQAYVERRDQLAPETVAIIEENLKIIDEALQKSRAALEADPSNRKLSELTAATYQMKVDFLRKTLSLSS